MRGTFYTINFSKPKFDIHVTFMVRFKYMECKPMKNRVIFHTYTHMILPMQSTK